jgi:hypothetical protein
MLNTDANSDDNRDDVSLDTLVGSTTSRDDTHQSPTTVSQTSTQPAIVVSSTTASSQDRQPTGTIATMIFESPESTRSAPSSSMEAWSGSSHGRSRSPSVITLPVPPVERVHTSREDPNHGSGQGETPLTTPRRSGHAASGVGRGECPPEAAVPAVCLGSLATIAVGLIIWRSLDSE